MLTVDDFETEQKYMNDKRRIMNRFICGTGVICGLSVVVIDDSTISVEPGVALDFSGREIVVDLPVVKKLSMLDGFENYVNGQDAKKYLYLCLDYEEEEKEPVHNITGSNHVEYNKYRETCHLFLTDQEPDAENLSNTDFFESSKKIYQENGIRIRQIVPRYAQAGEEIRFRVIVENMGQIAPIRFAYDLELVCLENKENHFIKVQFDEEMHTKSDRYELIYTIKAANVEDAYGTMEVDSGSFEFYVGGQRIETRVKQKFSIHISSQDIRDTIIKHYYQGAMEDIIKNNYQQSIYLAKIFVIRAGMSYMIDSIENMPFGQFVYNNVLGDIMNQLTIEETKQIMLELRKNQSEKNENLVIPNSGDGALVKTGSILLDLGIGGNVGQRFFSNELPHGLGLGNVTIILGACYENNCEGEVLYGSPEVFEESGLFRGELAAKVNNREGTFQIGMRLIEPTMNRYVRINWTAVKDPAENVHDIERKAIFIKPDMLYLKTRESYYLEAKFEGVEETQVKWWVKEENGGTIEKNGMYTAPNVPGIYEIIAESTIYDDLRTSIFVVVREIDK